VTRAASAVRSTDRHAATPRGAMMVPRWLPPVLVLFALLLGGALEVAFGQTPGGQGLDRLSPEERAIVERNRERWQRLNPEEQQRIRENFRYWQSLTPEQRQAARESMRRFRALPP